MACNFCKGIRAMISRSETNESECEISFRPVDGLCARVEFSVLGTTVVTEWLFYDEARFCPMCGDRLWPDARQGGNHATC